MAESPIETLAEKFFDEVRDRVVREIDVDRRPLVYHVRWGQDRQATYDPNGNRL